MTFGLNFERIITADFEALITKDGNLNWEGPLPEYSFFEPQRITLSDYQELLETSKNKSWNFLEISRQYIKGDVKALYQILVQVPVRYTCSV